MAYAYDGIATTQMGKIVYRRKKHSFGPRDLKRIIKSIGFPNDSERMYNWILALLDMVELARMIDHSEVRDIAAELALSLRTFISTDPAFAGFGGGAYGGGGSTGTWWRPFDV